ncbi:MAG: hypothetical protein WBG57_09400 [Ornithinimicrobium sp.]
MTFKASMPATRAGRLIVGILLIAGGILGFLPILGFWMVPLGLFVLSVDFPVIRRFRRRMTVRFLRWWHKLRGRGEH